MYMTLVGYTIYTKPGVLFNACTVGVVYPKQLPKLHILLHFNVYEGFNKEKRMSIRTFFLVNMTITIYNNIY